MIRSATGRVSPIYRFPGGSYGLSSSLIGAVNAHGMRYVDWNASTRDAELENPSVKEIFNSAVTTPANKNNIVLLAHDSTTKTATAKALKDIIKYYKGLNYTFAAF